MKKIILSALLTLIVGASAVYSQKQPFEKTNADAQKIIQFMTDWANLSNRHDIAALDKMLPADLVITFQDGEVLTKDEYIAALKKVRLVSPLGSLTKKLICTMTMSPLSAPVMKSASAK